jgi:hypothetical protein
VTIEDYAVGAGIKKKAFYEQFIKPLEETIQLSAPDIRVLATVCFVNSLSPNQQHLLFDPKKFEFCFLSSELVAELDSCQHQLLVKSAFAETHFEF